MHPRHQTLPRARLLLTVALLALLPLTLSAEVDDTFTVDNINYIILDEDDPMVGIQSSSNVKGRVVIPSTVSHRGVGYNVVAIYQDAFSGISGVTYLEIPPSVMYIAKQAFRESRIDSLTIAAAEEPIEISSGAFTFAMTSDFYLGRDLDSENSSPFNYLSINQLTIGDNVTKIGNSEFVRSYLTNVAMGKSIKTIGKSAFDGCDNLTTVIFNPELQSIGARAFLGCHSLSVVEFGDALQNIGESAFAGCDSLTLVSFGKGLQSIGAYAFQNCSSLTEIYSSALTPPEIVESTFEGRYNYASLGVPLKAYFDYAKHPVWKLFLNAYANGDIYRFSYDHSKFEATLTDVVNPAALLVADIPYIVTWYKNGTPQAFTVTSIAANAFQGCEVLKAVSIPATVTSIGEGAFYGCSALTGEITIPANVTEIGANAFGGRKLRVD